MNIKERVYELREALSLSQEAFGKKIGVGRSAVSNYESGGRNITEQVIKSIVREFNVNEEWLKTGQGEMFVQPSEFSLNEYAEKNDISELEFDLIKGYMDLDVDTRNQILSSIKSIFDKHSEVAATKENFIDEEVENYRLELEAEQKGEILSVSEDIKGRFGNKEAN